MPPPAGGEAAESAIGNAARAGHLFALLSDDPWRCRLDVYAGEPLPPDVERDFEHTGGSFLLLTPSRQVVAAAYEARTGEAASPGGPPVVLSSERHLVQVLTRRPFDGRRHETEMIALLGEDDWRYTRRVDRIGVAGCLTAALPILAAFGALVTRRGQWLLAYALPLILLAWAPFWVLRLTPRYKSIARRMRDQENGKPHYVMTLKPAEGTAPVEGGFLRVQP